jgi:hypothetical protein
LEFVFWERLQRLLMQKILLLLLGCWESMSLSFLWAEEGGVESEAVVFVNEVEVEVEVGIEDWHPGQQRVEMTLLLLLLLLLRTKCYLVRRVSISPSQGYCFDFEQRFRELKPLD